MSRESVTARGRSFEQQGHSDRFTVYRRTGETTTDSATKVESDVFSIVVADVAGALRQGEGRGEEARIPGAVVSVTGLFWHTSVDTLGVLTDDEVECIAVDPSVGDPDLVGVRVRVTGPFMRAYLTARRFPVEEIS